MKFTITYEFDAQYGRETPFWAKWGRLYKCGKSYAEARVQLIEELREIAKINNPVPPPPDEEVEL